MPETMPSFTTVHEGKQFVVRDQDGNIYGTYDTKAIAEQAVEDWEQYYISPLL